MGARAIRHRIQNFCYQLNPETPETVVFHLPGMGVTLHVQDVDRWSVVIDYLQFSWQVPSQRVATRHQFHDLVQQWCRTIHYLQEPLRLIEFEPSEWTALVRSDPPTAWDDDVRGYYEMWWYGYGDRWTARIERRRVQGDARPEHVVMVWPRDLLTRCLYDTWEVWQRIWTPAEAS